MIADVWGLAMASRRLPQTLRRFDGCCLPFSRLFQSQNAECKIIEFQVFWRVFKACFCGSWQLAVSVVWMDSSESSCRTFLTQPVFVFFLTKRPSTQASFPHSHRTKLHHAPSYKLNLPVTDQSCTRGQFQRCTSNPPLLSRLALPLHPSMNPAQLRNSRDGRRPAGF